MNNPIITESWILKTPPPKKKCRVVLSVAYNLKQHATSCQYQEYILRNKKKVGKEFQPCVH